MLRYVLYLVVLVFAVWTAATSLTQIESNERGIIRRFGRVLDEKPQQGLHIGLPWGIDRVDRVKVSEERTIKVGYIAKDERADDIVPPGQMLTGDHNLVNIEASINFRVRDREADMVKFLLHKDFIDAFVARAAESILAEWIAGRKVNDMVRNGKTELPLFLAKHLQDRLDPYDLGIQIEYASITQLVPPDEVKAAFDRLNNAQNTIETQVNQAKQKANDKTKDAEAEIGRINDQTKSYVVVQRQAADTEADNFLKRLASYRSLSRNDPNYLNALWLDEMTRALARMKDGGRLGLLDKTGELTITEFPLQMQKK